jgi:ABC-type branched-subunit amino acid transport system permease subunit
VSLLGAVAIGVIGVVTVSPSLAIFVAAGAFIVVAYNLELFGGRFHSDTWFAVAWGAFPALTSYWANALTLRVPGVGVAAGCFALSLAQRRLSTPVRELRRRTIHLSGTQTMADGSEVDLDVERLAAPLDGALRALTVAIVLIAAAVVWTRL